MKNRDFYEAFIRNSSQISLVVNEPAKHLLVMEIVHEKQQYGITLVLIVTNFYYSQQSRLVEHAMRMRLRIIISEIVIILELIMDLSFY